MHPFLATLRALGDPTRLRIVRILRQGAFNVNELVTILAMGQSRVSRHLRVLLDAGLVKARREGSWAYYTLSELWSGHRPPGVSQGPEPPRRFLRVLSEELARAPVPPEAAGDRAAIEACLDERRRRAETFFASGVAERFDRERDSIQGPQEHLDLLVELLGRSARTLVDLGTGTGVLLSRLSARAERVIGIDGADEMLRMARRRVTDERLENVELRIGALEHLPLSDGEADAMAANMVLHHVADPRDALREAGRGLRSGGRLVIAELLAHDEEAYRERLGDLWLGFEPADLERWLEEAGFEVEDARRLRDGHPEVILLSARSRGKSADGVKTETESEGLQVTEVER